MPDIREVIYWFGIFLPMEEPQILRYIWMTEEFMRWYLVEQCSFLDIRNIVRDVPDTTQIWFTLDRCSDQLDDEISF